jgi:hypothetical protein
MGLRPIIYKLAALLVLLGTSQNAGATTYVVRDGDSLSKIAQKNLGSPVYPETGSLKKLLALNPQIQDPTFILPGTVLELGAQDLQTTACVLPSADRTPAQEPEIVTAPAPSAIPATAEVPVAAASPVASPIPAAPFVVTAPSQPDKQPDKTAGTFGELGVETGFSFSKIVATDPNTQATASLYSNLDPTVGLNWKQHWSDSWESFLRFSYMQTSFQDPTPRTLSQSNEGVYGFGFGVKALVSRTFSLIFQAGYDQELFVQNVSSETLALLRISTPSATAGAQWELIKSGPFALGLGASLGALGPGSASGYTTRFGESYSGSAYLEEELRAINAVLRGEVYYQQRDQNSSVVNQSETDIGASIGLTWRLAP